MLSFILLFKTILIFRDFFLMNFRFYIRAIASNPLNYKLKNKLEKSLKSRWLSLLETASPHFFVDGLNGLLTDILNTAAYNKTYDSNKN